MKEETRQELIKKIQYYSEQVNGFKARRININYWNSLDDYQLTKVYKKWQELYSASAFTSLPGSEK